MRGFARLVGFALFIASFIVPSPWTAGTWWLGSGIEAFLCAAVGLLGAVLRPLGEWQAQQAFCTVCLALAFLANFTVFFKLRGVGAVLAVAAPWAAIGCSTGILRFVPFYMWASGISLIHASRLQTIAMPGE